MKRTQWMAIGAIVAFAALVGLLALRNRQPPFLPADADHLWHGAENCLRCHGPAGEHPQTPTHPVERDCVRCHGVAR